MRRVTKASVWFRCSSAATHTTTRALHECSSDANGKDISNDHSSSTVVASASLNRTQRTAASAARGEGDVPINPFHGKRVYHFFVNERGNLYHLYDIKAVLPALRRVKEDPTARQGLPSGPAHIRDWAFVDFFMKHLFINTNRYVPHLPQKEEREQTPSSCLSAVGEERTTTGGNTSATNEEHLSATSTSASSSSSTSTGFIDECDLPALTNTELFPYISYCGKEMNLIACERLPIVFQALIMEGDKLPSGVVDDVGVNDGRKGTSAATDAGERHSAGEDIQQKQQPTSCGSSIGGGTLVASRPLLIFGGTLVEPFDPSALRVDEEGYLYHNLASLAASTRNEREPGEAGRAARRTATSHRRVRPTIGLVGAEVGLRLGFEFIDEDPDSLPYTTVTREEGGNQQHSHSLPTDPHHHESSGAYVITWKGQTMKIPPLEEGRV